MFSKMPESECVLFIKKYQLNINPVEYWGQKNTGDRGHFSYLVCSFSCLLLISDFCCPPMALRDFLSMYVSVLHLNLLFSKQVLLSLSHSWWHFWSKDKGLGTWRDKQQPLCTQVCRNEGVKEQSFGPEIQQKAKLHHTHWDSALEEITL